jgi:hypothetical protein
MAKADLSAFGSQLSAFRQKRENGKVDILFILADR